MMFILNEHKYLYDDGPAWDYGQKISIKSGSDPKMRVILSKYRGRGGVPGMNLRAKKVNSW